MQKILAGLVLGAAMCGVVGCEKKEPEAPKVTTDAGKSATDALKNAGAKVADAGSKAVDAAKDAGTKAVDATKDAAAKAADAAKDAGSKAAAALSDDVKKTFDGYSKSLGDFGGLLEGIKTKADATAKLPEVKPMMDKVNAAMASLTKLSPEVQASIKSTFKTQLEPLTKKVTDQIARLTADHDIGAVLGDALKGFKAF